MGWKRRQMGDANVLSKLAKPLVMDAGEGMKARKRVCEEEKREGEKKKGREGRGREMVMNAGKRG